MSLMDSIKKNLNWPPTLENSRNSRSIGSLPTTSITPPVIETKNVTQGGPPPVKEPTVETIVTLPNGKEDAVNTLKRLVFTDLNSPYLQVMKTAEKLVEFIADEEKRIHAALALSNVSRELVSEDIAKSLSKVITERDRLKRQAEMVIETKTSAAKATITEHEESIANIDTQIASLNLSLNRLAHERDELEAKVEDLKNNVALITEGDQSTFVIDAGANEIMLKLLNSKKIFTEEVVEDVEEVVYEKTPPDDNAGKEFK